jgi:hypothetical protein
VAATWLIGNQLRSTDRSFAIVLHGSPNWPLDVLVLVFWGVPVILAALLLSAARKRWRGLGGGVLTLATVGMMLTALLLSTSDSVFISGVGQADDPKSIVHLLPVLAVLGVGWMLARYLPCARQVIGASAAEN